MARRFMNSSTGRGWIQKGDGGGKGEMIAWTLMRPLHDQFWGNNLLSGFQRFVTDLGFHNLDI